MHSCSNAAPSKISHSGVLLFLTTYSKIWSLFCPFERFMHSTLRGGLVPFSALIVRLCNIDPVVYSERPLILILILYLLPEAEMYIERKENRLKFVVDCLNECKM